MYKLNVFSDYVHLTKAFQAPLDRMTHINVYPAGTTPIFVNSLYHKQLSCFPKHLKKKGLKGSTNMLL